MHKNHLLKLDDNDHMSSQFSAPELDSAESDDVNHSVSWLMFPV